MILEETKIQYDEGIGFGNNNEGVIVYKEVEDPNYYTDMYEAGQTKQTLKIGQEVEGEVSGGGVVVTTIIIPTGLSLGNYDMISSDIGFTPKWASVKAGVESSGVKATSDVHSDGVRTGGLYSYGGDFLFTDKRIINIFCTGSDRFQANFVSFIPGGIRVEITRNINLTAVNVSIMAGK